MNQFLRAIAEEKEGFSFGESWRYSEDSLVALLPILRDLNRERKYFLLREPRDVTTSDTGQINKLRVNNKSEKPVYIRMGEIFAGKTQERMAVRSYVIMPKEIVDIEVRCVHASKGIVSGETMSSSITCPTTIVRRLSVTQFKGKSVRQRDVWGDITLNASVMCAASDNLSKVLGDSTTGLGAKDMGVEAVSFTDNLGENLRKFSKSIEKILEKVPYFKNQVGLVTIGKDGVMGIEAFDLKQSWKILKDDIVKKEGVYLSDIQKDSPFEFKKERAVGVVQKVLKLDFDEKVVFKSKDYRVIGLDSEKYTGEITELGGEVIHFTIVDKSI